MEENTSIEFVKGITKEQFGKDNKGTKTIIEFKSVADGDNWVVTLLYQAFYTRNLKSWGGVEFEAKIIESDSDTAVTTLMLQANKFTDSQEFRDSLYNAALREEMLDSLTNGKNND